MISVASSIKFRKDDGLLPSFDNTPVRSERFGGAAIHTFMQTVYNTDTVTLQAKVLNGYTVDLYYKTNCSGIWTKLSSGTKEVDGATYDYWEIDIDFSATPFDAMTKTIFKLNVLDSGSAITETWYSEPVEIISEASVSYYLEGPDEDLMYYSKYLKIEFYNFDNAFQVDYSTGIVHLLRVRAEMKELRSGGEGSFFDNQEEITRTSGEVKQILVLKTAPIPRYLAMMLKVAVTHDKFFVNEVEFVAEADPDIENSLSNLVTFSCALTQREVIGLNTHDTGFDCDEYITGDVTMVLQEDTVSGQTSFTVPEGYLLHSITGQRTAGSPTITAGTTPGGVDILPSMELTASYVIETATINMEIAYAGDATLYVEVSGAGATANIYAILINNRQ